LKYEPISLESVSEKTSGEVSVRMRYKTPLAAALIAMISVASRAAVIDANPSDYKQKIASLTPGDTLRLAAGTYTRLTLADLNGLPGAPITIQGAVAGTLIVGESCCNTVQIQRCSYVAIKGLTIDSLGMDGIDGINAKDGASHDILIEGNTIQGVGGSQQTVGISTKSIAWNWIVRGNTIDQPGTGMYFGNSDGTMPFIAGIIEDNLVVHPEGYAIQVKQQLPYADANAPSGPSSTIIRNNVLIKDDRPSGDGDRPNLLVDGFPDSGQGSADLYEIYGNFIFHNPRESLVQASGRVAIHDNVLVGAGAGQTAVYLADHNAPLKVAYVYNNTIYGGANGIRFASAARENDLVLGNAVFADQPISGSIANVRDNIVDAIAQAPTYVAAPAYTLGTMDFYPRPGRLEGPALTYPAAVKLEADWSKDFNGTDKQTGTFRGAYAGSGTNPGWRLDQGIKPLNTAPVAPLPMPPSNVQVR
jgi:hypothetical protein